MSQNCSCCLESGHKRPTCPLWKKKLDYDKMKKSNKELNEKSIGKIVELKKSISKIVELKKSNTELNEKLKEINLKFEESEKQMKELEKIKKIVKDFLSLKDL
jgi:DNA topoisomerase VI subunit A